MTWVSWSLLIEPSFLQTLCTDPDFQFRGIHSLLLYEKGCALQHHISCLHRQKSMKWKLCTLIGQSFSHFKCHPSVRDSSFQASTLSLHIFCIFPLIYFSLTDLSHTQHKAWTDLSLHKFASYLLTHVQLDLCKVRNFCLLHSADW